MTKIVKIDNDLHEYIIRHAKYGESFTQILRRLLKGVDE